MSHKSFNYIDIHAHLNFAAFNADREEVIQRALRAGVAVINVGTQKDTSRKAVEIAEKSLPAKTAVLPLGKGESGREGVYAIVGLHPIHTSKSFHDTQELGETDNNNDNNNDNNKRKGFTSRGEEFDYAYYKKLAAHPKVIGIGECGLDYFRFTNNDLGFKEELRKQEEAFKQQIVLANEVGKPLMLHVRNGFGHSAYRDALAILKREAKVGGDFHFFAGSWDEAKGILDAGFHLSFTGVITFTHDYDEIVKNAPLDRILSETDSPYVAPVPYRGKRNEPFYVREVVKTIAYIRGDDEEKVRAQILKNAEALFGITLS